MKSFASDYNCKTHPHIADAWLAAAAQEHGQAYGEDVITKDFEACLQEKFAGWVEICIVSNGTAANRLALQTMLRAPYESVICAERAHINTAEAGAIESLGHKTLPVPTVHGKIRLEALETYMMQRGNKHLTYPRVLSISNPTEVGTVYSKKELAEITKYAHDNDLALHIDGARLSNAAVHLNTTLENASITEEANRDPGHYVVTIGATKNGGGNADAVVFFNTTDGMKAERIHKQQGQLSARHYLSAIQLKVMFADGLWHKNATNANTMAQTLARRCQEELDIPHVYPVESNAVFVRLPNKVIGKLQEEADFHVWEEGKTNSVVRWVCSWDTKEEDVDEFIKLIASKM